MPFKKIVYRSFSSNRQTNWIVTSLFKKIDNQTAGSIKKPYNFEGYVRLIKYYRKTNLFAIHIYQGGRGFLPLQEVRHLFLSVNTLF